jgi:hypothetical protein
MARRRVESAPELEMQALGIEVTIEPAIPAVGGALVVRATMGGSPEAVRLRTNARDGRDVIYATMRRRDEESVWEAAISPSVSGAHVGRIETDQPTDAAEFSFAVRGA